MNLSRKALQDMQETAPALSDQQRLENLRAQRDEQLRLAHGWKEVNPMFSQSHLANARAFHKMAKDLQAKIQYEDACAKMAAVMGEEPIPQGDYDDITEYFMKVEENENGSK